MRQTQSLVMTPQLLQSIRLLQLTHVELAQFIDEEMERNPFLDRADSAETHGDDGRADDRKADGLGETAGGGDASDEPWSAASMSERLDSSLENVFPDDPGAHDRIGPDLSAQWKSASGTGIVAAYSDAADLEDTMAARTTLRDHMAEQIAFALTDPACRMIAFELAENLDEAGYLAVELFSVAEHMGVEAAKVAAVLAICQTFDPPGLFARDLSECLSLQLAARDRLDPAMRALLAHLDLLARRDFRALERLCGVGQEDLADMLAEIRTLDPKPGTAFSVATADPVAPDVIVRAASDGSWAVELNNDTLPRVLVDQSYFAVVSAKASAEERQFLSQCLQSANWLSRSLDQRARTILKVASEIVRQQDAFLAHGVRHLKPLNLRAIAEAISMHESTVSRVTANKYMMTPRGLFELRYFFTAAIAGANGGEAHSAESVRDRIRKLIAGESVDAVLSDDTIVTILRGEGVDVARRTVAKYRESMNIASSVQRRREMRAAGSVMV